jgi:hypothetical protein
LLDATWMKEERTKIIYKQHSSFLDAARLHRQVAKRVVFAIHILKQGDNVTRGQPSGQASDAVLGLGNTISKVKSINLDDYMPDWEKNGSIIAKTHKKNKNKKTPWLILHHPDREWRGETMILSPQEDLPTQDSMEKENHSTTRTRTLMDNRGTPTASQVQPL